uniref:hypothetical protein n=1 Tax=Pararhizobium sp. IMCC3301 TaxID=3067904 RepID=UPI002741AB42|nr:hypothetical protein [Pararhizobium sp. IMCC3301]
MFDTSRRKLLGASMLGAGAVMNGLGAGAKAAALNTRGNIMLDRIPDLPKGLIEAASFPLIDAIHGRRSRRFAKGASIPNGPLAYTSERQPAALSELEQMLLLTTVAGNTGWSNLIPYNRYYLPNMPNYAGAAGGRSFPSAAGFHTSEFFFTDDNGVYAFKTRDMPATQAKQPDGSTDLKACFDEHKSRIVKLADGRLHTPARPEHMEMHNEWCANVPGSTLIIPVADLAQHMILALCYLVQNGACLYDDVNNRPIPGLEKFKNRVDIENPFPLSYIEQLSLTEVTVELSCACYAGTLMLQAMGLGGWMYEGINPFSILGASGDPDVPGLGFRFDMIKDQPLPHVTGLEGVFEGHCPPHFANMRAAVEAVITRKFGKGGPFNAKTKGPYKETGAIRSKAAPIDAEFIDCVSAMADYVFYTFGRFPATVPAIFTLMYLQAHQLDTDFYDTHFSDGAYLETHARHDLNWN